MHCYKYEENGTGEVNAALLYVKSMVIHFGAMFWADLNIMLCVGVIF